MARRRRFTFLGLLFSSGEPDRLLRGSISSFSGLDGGLWDGQADHFTAGLRLADHCRHQVLLSICRLHLRLIVLRVFDLQVLVQAPLRSIDSHNIRTSVIEAKVTLLLPHNTLSLLTHSFLDSPRQGTHNAVRFHWLFFCGAFCAHQ